MKVAWKKELRCLLTSKKRKKNMKNHLNAPKLKARLSIQPRRERPLSILHIIKSEETLLMSLGTSRTWIEGQWTGSIAIYISSCFTSNFPQLNGHLSFLNKKIAILRCGYFILRLLCPPTYPLSPLTPLTLCPLRSHSWFTGSCLLDGLIHNYPVKYS